MPINPNGIWIIDFRTASLIIEEEPPERVALIDDLCTNGSMKVIHRERAKFAQDPVLCPCYIDKGCCVNLCEGIIERSKIIKQQPALSTIPLLDQSALFIAAAAVHFGYQVISDSLITAGLSVSKICHEIGIPHVTRLQLFNYLTPPA